MIKQTAAVCGVDGAGRLPNGREHGSVGALRKELRWRGRYGTCRLTLITCDGSAYVFVKVQGGAAGRALPCGRCAACRTAHAAIPMICRAAESRGLAWQSPGCRPPKSGFGGTRDRAAPLSACVHGITSRHLPVPPSCHGSAQVHDGRRLSGPARIR
ncbi:hypothetical protein CENSYa_1396 [Cenarchaeum symbiosum A]|uniref:Uncharacterized protein n=1 Tax=Cenarchaeum symbiosum (strain A) TaxID=414004 RepID=A0RXF2_CENSY|nr:hypothetical protein CENSYa_1396 [Cenarchaeum symbiosum A]